MALDTTSHILSPEALERLADSACRQIPPVWPLASSVAVNPYLGQSSLSLAETGQLLGRISKAPVTMPRDWYAARIESGEITEADLAAALAASGHAGKPADTNALKAAAGKTVTHNGPVPMMADLLAEKSGFDWPGFIAERTGAWAAGYFDAGQAMWTAPRNDGAWASWRAFAMADLSPGMMGFSGFRALVGQTPADAAEAIEEAVAVLGLSEAAVPGYFHQVLMSQGGWAQVARYELWKAELAGKSDSTLTGLLAIALTWEAALFTGFGADIAPDWADAVMAHATPEPLASDFVINEILQEAKERAVQRRLAGQFTPRETKAPSIRPALQAAFCIDVRSEVFRRALESTDTGVRTLGFAGFFGLATRHSACGSDVEELRLPVLLNHGLTSGETQGGAPEARAENETRYVARAKRAWGRFRQAAVSSFAFVEATGPVYAAKLVSDALSRTTQPVPGAASSCPQPDMDTDAQIAAAAGILGAMSLTDGFARLVLLCGHGATATNNPHASGLQCGACGGYSGEVNARLLAGILNRPAVRKGLSAKGINIPADTVFVAGLHDTTTDDVTLYTGDVSAPDHTADLARAQSWLQMAGNIARSERLPQLPGATTAPDVQARAQDWAETRPEWGLAGCRAFVAAPRAQTSGDSLSGQVFLHEYDHQRDARNGYPVLELILTAPVVVASWISLQYYGSSVAPDVFGSGNKLLHNVTGGIGVFEGNGGVLRTGLAMQSVHDGAHLRHDPLRLSVYVAAPHAAISDILARHPQVRALFDNRWLHLFALADDGTVTHRYTGDLEWADEKSS
ncbi:YbcC family protein [uncultured Roseobacter sp.]|uniref:YbcC family protein n=1 Tax=uncultured Roseobacter sp. TaxID=114847 RepID=UPI00262D3AA9|nr:DUF2309 domain-containing protein [uncultured Roseobacter sp.]